MPRTVRLYGFTAFKEPFLRSELPRCLAAQRQLLLRSYKWN